MSFFIYGFHTGTASSKCGLTSEMYKSKNDKIRNDQYVHESANRFKITAMTTQKNLSEGF